MLWIFQWALHFNFPCVQDVVLFYDYYMLISFLLISPSSHAYIHTITMKFAGIIFSTKIIEMPVEIGKACPSC